MNNLMLAAWQNFSFGEIAIAIVIFVAIIALVTIFVRQSGVAIPAWLVNVFWVVVAAVVVIGAIKIVLSL